MPRVIVHHSVKNFEEWKKIFAEHQAERKSAGFTKSRVFQKIGEPNQVTIQLDHDDLEKAKAFMQSVELTAAMAKAGVASVPIVHILNDGETFES